jgi:hypothetical protein
MKNGRCNKWFMWLLACCFAGVSLAARAQPDVDGNPDSSAFIRIPSDTDDWTRHFRIGALVGMNISANFSMKGNFNVSGNNPASGIYDDGYVHTDQTGDPNYTSYWGYNYASQYNSAGGGTIAMHSTSSFAASGSSKEENSVFAGFDLAYGGNLWYWKHARVGWELGFGLLPIDIKNNSSMSANVIQRTDIFNAGGIVVPNAPYQGGPSGIGPIISTAFTSSLNATNAGTVTGSHSLDVMLYNVRLGPTFYWDLGEHVGMELGAGPAVGIVSGDYKYDETITAANVSAHNTGSFGTTDVTFGGYVNATLMYHVENNADIYLGAQYMPMENADFSGSGRQAQLNLSGQVYISAGINWPF